MPFAFIPPRALIELGDRIQATISRWMADVEAARQQAIRKSIWKNQPARKRSRERTLMDVANIGLGDEYVMGLPSVDKHRRMIALMFNGIVKELLAVDDPACLDTANIFHKLYILLSVINDNFLEEERKMATLGYPGTFRHKHQHDIFMTGFVRLMDEVKDQDCGLEEIVFFIGSWWSAHALVSDRGFAEFLSRQGQSRDPGSPASGQMC